MILWTIQAEGAWRKAQRTGFLRADGRREWRCFRDAYRWMRSEMYLRVGDPPFGVRHPLWAWLQCDGVRKKRPDLRRSGHLSAGERGVLIEFNVAEEQVLLSDFDLWHYVLNRWYLPQTPSELRDELGDALRDVATPHQREASWQRIFELDWHLEGVSVPRAQRSIQATIWHLPLNAVRSARVFRAR